MTMLTACRCRPYCIILKASHAYYIDFQLPFIRKELVEALDEKDNLARLILKLYDDYAHSITKSHEV